MIWLLNGDEKPLLFEDTNAICFCRNSGKSERNPDSSSCSVDERVLLIAADGRKTVVFSFALLCKSSHRLFHSEMIAWVKRSTCLVVLLCWQVTSEGANIFYLLPRMNKRVFGDKLFQ